MPDDFLFCNARRSSLTEEPPPLLQRRFEFIVRWTRTQRIRTAAAIRVEAIIVDQTEPPVYLRIAEKAKQLRELGMTDRAIARAMGVSDKTIAKAAGGPALSCPTSPDRRSIS